MATGTNDTQKTDVRAFLPWLIDMGADEVVLDAPVNRFAGDTSKEEPAVTTSPPQQALPSLPPRTVAVQAGDSLAQARALVSAAQSISALTEAWQAFEAHPLKRTATRLCFFAGATAARALMLCDKPRSEEDPTGEVLSGKHQVLAENMLAAIGLCGVAKRDGLEQVAMANFVPWRPPGNRAVADMEARLSVPFIHQLLRLLRPKAVICLGSLPGQFLAEGDSAITRARGKWRSIAIDGVELPLMTTFHPETLLKSPQSKKLAWTDLQAFRDRLNAP